MTEKTLTAASHEIDEEVRKGGAMNLEFSDAIWHWAGPAPFFFVTVPPLECEVLRGVSKWVTYGWGMIPVKARIGKTKWKTSLFPKEGGYVVPIKVGVRQVEGLEEGNRVTVQLEVGQGARREHDAICD